MTSLALYEKARAALAKATRIDEVMEVKVEVEHIKLYAKQIKDQRRTCRSRVTPISAFIGTKRLFPITVAIGGKAPARGASGYFR